ncbi:MAG: hypothetical protein NW207_12995 [Cytophagales bacterium]|nr:hypothetical protein [Cytophagales bacterium]
MEEYLIFDEEFYYIKPKVSDTANASSHTEAPQKIQYAPPVKLPPAPIIASKPQSIIHKKIMVIAHYTDTVQIPEQVQQKLNNTFLQLNQPLEQMIFINLAHIPPHTLNQYKYQYLILLGGSGKNIEILHSYKGDRTPHNFDIHNNIKILFAHTIEKYASDRLLAQKFWTLLQEIFKK